MSYQVLEQQLIFLLVQDHDYQKPVEKWGIGQRIGTGYYVFKVILRTNLPTDLIKSNELIKLMRQTEQQANALNRELKTSLHKIKQDLREQIPEELKKNPHQMLQLKDYRKSEIQETTSLYGSEVIAKSLQERARLKREKQQRGQLNNFSKSL